MWDACKYRKRQAKNHNQFLEVSACGNHGQETNVEYLEQNIVDSHRNN
jgi:hypothetical protein